MSYRKRLAAGVTLLLIPGAVLWVWFKPWSRAPLESGQVSDADKLLQAEVIARDAIRANPNDPSTHLQLLRVLRQLGRSKDAEVVLGRAIQLGLPESEGRREYVLLLAIQNWPPQAEGILQQAVHDYPDDMEVLLAVARAYTAKQFWLKAEPVFTQLLARDPEQLEWRFQRGMARMQIGKHAKAADDFRQVLHHNPAHFEGRLYLAHSLLGDGRMAEAEKELQACRQARPDLIESLIGLAKCAVERGDLAETEKLLDEAAAINGISPLVLQDQAALYLRQQRNDRAIATLKQLIAIDPNHRQGHLQLAQALLASGNEDEARRHERIYQELDHREEERLAALRGMR